MTPAISLGRFVVNLGLLTGIPCGEGRLFRIGAQSIAVFHTRDANVFATESGCPLAGCSLAEGMVGAEKLICPTHNCVFDLTDGHAEGRECRALKTYPATLNGDGEIVVGIESLLKSRELSAASR